MVGLVIATHGRLAEELVATAEQIVGTLPSVATCSIDASLGPEEVRARLRAAVDSVDTGDGVVVMADLFGGTPCKESLSLLDHQGNLEVLVGVNLPMLLKAGSLRKEPMALGELAHALELHAQRNIRCASALLRGAPATPPTTSGGGR